MKWEKIHWVGLCLVGASWAIALSLYSEMSDPVPIHWKMDGTADSFLAKPFGALVMPLATSFVFALSAILPAISPKQFELKSFARSWAIIHLMLVGGMVLVTAGTALKATGSTSDFRPLVFAGMGVLLMVLGNFMGKFRRNFFIGIRTPWTLTNEEVWLRTHRLGGKLFVSAGLALTVSSMFEVAQLVAMVGFATALAVPSVYSFVLYRRLEGGSNKATS